MIFLAYSKPLHEFCGFTKVPDASKITRFKQDFLEDLQVVFDNLSDLTEPICQAIDSEKADMTIFDLSGIEAFVTENNPKYANRIIKQLKAYAKVKGLDKSYDPYKAAYGSISNLYAYIHSNIFSIKTINHFWHKKFSSSTVNTVMLFLYETTPDYLLYYVESSSFQKLDFHEITRPHHFLKEGKIQP